MVFHGRIGKSLVSVKRVGYVRKAIFHLLLNKLLRKFDTSWIQSLLNWMIQTSRNYIFRITHGLLGEPTPWWVLMCQIIKRPSSSFESIFIVNILFYISTIGFHWWGYKFSSSGKYTHSHSVYLVNNKKFILLNVKHPWSVTKREEKRFWF